MPVLNIAGQQADASDDRSPTATGGNGQTSTDDATVRVDIADRLSAAVEEFVTGLIPGRTAVDINWGSLSPIFSVIGDIVGVAGLLVGWL